MLSMMVYDTLVFIIPCFIELGSTVCRSCLHILSKALIPAFCSQLSQANCGSNIKSRNLWLPDA